MTVNLIRNRVMSIAVVLFLILQLAGCANMSDQSRTRAEGAGVGALVGGLIGLAAGDTKGAIIGALAGAGVGYLVGNEIAKRKAKYASEEDFLNGEINYVAQINETTRKYNRQLASDIKRLNRQVRSLRASYDKHKVKKDKLVKKKAEIQKKIAKNDQMLKELEKEYKVNVAILDEQKKKGKEKDPKIAKLEKEVEILKKNIDALQKNAKQLAEMDERLSV